MSVLNFYTLGLKVPANAVYIGRASPKHGLPRSVLANPFPITATLSREQSIAAYRDWLWQSLQRGDITEQTLLDLEGKDLVCYCAPRPCHGNVIEAAVAWAVRRRQAGLTGCAVAPCHETVDKDSRPDGVEATSRRPEPGG